jgi:hypothetical protein
MRKVLFKITKRQLVHLQSIHHTDSEIAKVLELSSARVYQLRKEHGIPIYTIGKHNRSRNRFIYTSFTENHIPKRELSKTYKLSFKTISRIIDSFKQEKLINDNK